MWCLSPLALSLEAWCKFNVEFGNIELFYDYEVVSGGIGLNRVN